MPVVVLERIPLPSLQTYSAVSVVLLSCALFYSYQLVVNVEDITKVHAYENSAFGIGGLSHPEDAPPQGLVSEDDDDGVTVEVIDPNISESTVDREDLFNLLNFTLPYESLGWNVLHVMTTEGWCIVVNSYFI